MGDIGECGELLLVPLLLPIMAELFPNERGVSGVASLAADATLFLEKLNAFIAMFIFFEDWPMTFVLLPPPIAYIESKFCVNAFDKPKSLFKTINSLTLSEGFLCISAISLAVS